MVETAAGAGCTQLTAIGFCTITVAGRSADPSACTLQALSVIRPVMLLGGGNTLKRWVPRKEVRSLGPACFLADMGSDQFPQGHSCHHLLPHHRPKATEWREPHPTRVSERLSTNSPFLLLHQSLSTLSAWEKAEPHCHVAMPPQNEGSKGTCSLWSSRSMWWHRGQSTSTCRALSAHRYPLESLLPATPHVTCSAGLSS